MVRLEHALLAAHAGVKQMIVGVNKMDDKSVGTLKIVEINEVSDFLKNCKSPLITPQYQIVSDVQPFMATK
jgi:translation elongation factor EF-1alpha